MSRARALLLALAGLLLPVGLALGVYLTSAGSLAAVPTVIEPPAQVARSATTETAETPTQTDTTTTETTDGGDDDLPGKCKDPDHALDPDCDPRSAQDDDSSGRGSGGSGGGGDSSGKGSGGSGGGDDDSSGHGSGGGDD